MIAILATGFLCPGQSLAHELAPVDAARGFVVSVLPQWQGRPPNAAQPEGSGVVIGDGKRVITAAHVIGAIGNVAKDVLVRDNDGNLLVAKVLLHDFKVDLAILGLEQGIPPANWVETDINVGESVCAIGNAFGLGLSVTCGHISALHKAGVGFNPIENFIQTDAAVNPGMSGGALVNNKGELLGILSAIFTKRTDANIGVNFAVDGTLVRKFISASQNDMTIQLFDPGFAVRAVPQKGMPGREGVEVLQFYAGFAAENAGMKVGDIIYDAAGRRVRSKADWVSVLATVAVPGDFIVHGQRDGKAMVWRFPTE
jgi:S1-C subfamily serine protease